MAVMRPPPKTDGWGSTVRQDMDSGLSCSEAPPEVGPRENGIRVSRRNDTEATWKERSRTNREQSGSSEPLWTSFTDVLEIRNMKVGGLRCPAFLLFFCLILFTHFSPGYRDFVS
jgi:hypothetical protein